ncbi:pectin lyase fold/virulence factor [Phycomyces nitens]|nr:pectin lyase fold/virulence factor [Phycomyces nitens]
MHFFGISSIASILLLGISATQAATVCTVKTSSTGDDSVSINAAFAACKNGGTVVFPAGATFNMKSVVSATGLSNVNVEFGSTVNLPAYNTAFQSAIAYFYLAGDKIHFSGNGVFYGNGQAWYNAVNRNAPVVFKPKATNSYFGGFTIKQAPRAHFSINGCSNTIFENLTINTVSSNSNYPAKNTDAFDVSGSTGITIRNSNIVNGDDCIAVNGGVSGLTVSGLTCTGSHGFSVGSLGKDGKTDVVSNLNFLNNKCINCQNGVRIKTWPGGKGSVSNVKFDNINLQKVDNPIIITTHYCDNEKSSSCNSASTSLSISGVTLNNIYGSVSSTAKEPIVNINCSTGSHCKDVTLTAINITPASNTPKNVCTNLDGSTGISYCK